MNMAPRLSLSASICMQMMLWLCSDLKGGKGNVIVLSIHPISSATLNLWRILSNCDKAKETSQMVQWILWEKKKNYGSQHWSITVVELWGHKTQIHKRLSSGTRMLLDQVIILGQIKQSKLQHRQGEICRANSKITLKCLYLSLNSH